MTNKYKAKQLYFTKGQLQFIKHTAQKTNVSQSELVRSIVEWYTGYRVIKGKK